MRSTMMRATLTTVLLLALCPGPASADALPACERGQHLETNPSPPGAMHHGGGHCVDDPGGCAISRGASTTPLALLALAALALTRRRRLGLRASQ